MKKILVAIAFLTFGFTGVQAQYDSRYDGRRDHRANHRSGDVGERNSEINMMQRRVRDEISTGVRRGTLSSREASHLMRQYDRIEIMQRKFNSRGRISNREERILHNDLESLMAETRRLSSRRHDNWARGRQRF
jgi:hypothetical protein